MTGWRQSSELTARPIVALNEPVAGLGCAHGAWFDATGHLPRLLDGV